jgi:hypothetical protein
LFSSLRGARAVSEQVGAAAPSPNAPNIRVAHQHELALLVSRHLRRQTCAPEQAGQQRQSGRLHSAPHRRGTRCAAPERGCIRG